MHSVFNVGQHPLADYLQRAPPNHLNMTDVLDILLNITILHITESLSLNITESLSLLLPDSLQRAPNVIINTHTHTHTPITVTYTQRHIIYVSKHNNHEPGILSLIVFDARPPPQQTNIQQQTAEAKNIHEIISRS